MCHAPCPTAHGRHAGKQAGRQADMVEMNDASIECEEREAGDEGRGSALK